MRKALNARQERFCEFVAAGDTQAAAYLKAGFNVPKADARKPAARLMTKDDIKARIADLRKPQTKKTLMSRDDKRAKLCQIAENESIGTMGTLRALELDAKLAGHFAPETVEIESAKCRLADIMERANHVRSMLSIAYQVEPREKSPNETVPPTSPVERSQRAADSEPVPEPAVREWCVVEGGLIAFEELEARLNETEAG